jgi:hypothetical protein
MSQNDIRHYILTGSKNINIADDDDDDDDDDDNNNNNNNNNNNDRRLVQAT